MRLPKNILVRLLKSDVLSQVVPGLPVVELAGDARLLLENHRGVIEYGDERIGVMVNFGSIAVYGQNLTLQSMTGNQLVICGEIQRIELKREDVEKRGR